MEKKMVASCSESRRKLDKETQQETLDSSAKRQQRKPTGNPYYPLVGGIRGEPVDTMYQADKTMDEVPNRAL